MISSLYRILVIGRVTLTEAIRQKVLTVLLLFAVVLVSCSVFISGIATPGLDNAGLFAEQIKFVKDVGCGAIGIFGFFIALLSTAQLIPQELHNRTISTILAKPVRRSEFLLGKFTGIVLLLALCVAIMSIAFSGALAWEEQVSISKTKEAYADLGDLKAHPDALARYEHEIKDIKDQIRDPQMIEAILLIFTKLVMTSAIALLISTFATSAIFTIITTFLIYLIGHCESIAREYWLWKGAGLSVWQSGLIGLIAMLIPDFNSFSIVDEILNGNHIPWAHTLNLMGYADIYVIVLLAVSVVIFDHREL